MAKKIKNNWASSVSDYLAKERIVDEKAETVFEIKSRLKTSDTTARRIVNKMVKDGIAERVLKFIGKQYVAAYRLTVKRNK